MEPIYIRTKKIVEWENWFEEILVEVDWFMKVIQYTPNVVEMSEYTLSKCEKMMQDGPSGAHLFNEKTGKYGNEVDAPQIENIFVGCTCNLYFVVTDMPEDYFLVKFDPKILMKKEDESIYLENEAFKTYRIHPLHEYSYN